ncbi:MAG: T9SS C-terminal target domain-containing protein, partial [Cloacibacterium sp.]
MKKNLLTLSLVGVCAFVNAQLTYVGNGALVHVQDKALVYSGGGVKLDGNAKVNTIGDFMVVTSSQSFEVAPTADFRLQYSSSSVYGQLYIKGMPQANITGKVNKEYVDVKHGNTGRQQVALPFYNYSISISNEGEISFVYIPI